MEARRSRILAHRRSGGRQLRARGSLGLSTHRILRRVWRRAETSPAGPLAWRLRLIPRTVRRRVGRVLGRAALAISGPDAIGSDGAATARSSWGRLPRTWQVVPRPRSIDAGWPDPPSIENADRVVRSIYATGERPPVMDLGLLEALNEEYREKPLVPEAPGFDQGAREDRARRRLLDIHNSIDLADKRVLELGCGPGFEIWYMSHAFGADAWGVDVTERVAWAALADERTHFACEDIALGSQFEPDFFDRIVSFSVLEHVVHPHTVLAELYRILKPGGVAYLSANLHRGPRASHIYRELFFPFPHLLFSDDVIRAFREKHSGVQAGASWVNRLTWAQYEDYLREIGFVLRSLRFSEEPLDEGFYERFSNILGRYPRWDLTKDFFHVIVQKPAAAVGREPGERGVAPAG
jgi:SAM-dependent methyltransferase